MKPYCIEYLKVWFRYRRKMGKWGNINYPELFSEKLQWLKLHAKSPLYTTLVDKYAVKGFVNTLLGPGYTIPTIGVYGSSGEINWDALPDRFVLKCTHDSGGIRICKDKASFNRSEASAFLDRRLKVNYSTHKSEWVYEAVPRRIIAEEYVTEGAYTDEHGLPDYKFMCFGGKAHSVMVCVDRGLGEVKYYFFDREWNLLRINQWGAGAPDGFTLPKPAGIDRMFGLAERLSAGMPFVRVDLYNVNGRILFGEYTFFPKSGLDLDLLPSTDIEFGKLLKL